MASSLHYILLLAGGGEKHLLFVIEGMTFESLSVKYITTFALGSFMALAMEFTEGFKTG